MMIEALMVWMGLEEYERDECEQQETNNKN